MSEKMVFLALQDNEDARPIRESIEADNPNAVITQYPGLYKIDAPGRLVVYRESVEARIGRSLEPAGHPPDAGIPVRKHRRDRRLLR